MRLKTLESISPKASRATDFRGVSDIIPESQIFGPDFDVIKSDAYWISAWILEKKNIRYSRKKEAWFDSKSRQILPTYTVTHHIPEKIDPVKNNVIDHLKK